MTMTLSYTLPAQERGEGSEGGRGREEGRERENTTKGWGDASANKMLATQA